MNKYAKYGDSSGAETNGEDVLEKRSFDEPNAYPDPEDVPSYPWIGSHIVTDEANIRQSPCMLPRPSWVLQISDSDDDTDGANQLEQEQLHAQIGQIDSSVDPDFHCSGESHTSGEFLSEAETEAPAPTSRRRGRPPGNSGAHSLPNRTRSSVRGRGGPGIKRGPRKPLEPNSEFKVLQSQATTAYIAHDYDEAEKFGLRAIEQNPEMFTAHSLLSEVYMARGDRDKATAALFNGAHTRPGDIQVWLRVRTLLLERDTDHQNSLIPDAIYCLTRVLSIQPRNKTIRYERASLNRKLGYLGRAANEYEQLLKYYPHDVVVLRHLAEAYVDLGDIDRALQRYEECIAYHQSHELSEASMFSWSDVNVYVELYGYEGQYEIGIQKLKSLSRWLLGRRQEHVWEAFSTDDREWDAEDYPRRVQVDGFVQGAFDPSAYGKDLPLELRVKLGVYRLKLGDTEEALGHFAWLDPEDDREDAKLFDYPDLFKEVAEALQTLGLFREALTYFEPLQEVSGFADAAYFCSIAICYWKIDRRTEAEDSFQAAMESDRFDTILRRKVNDMCDGIGSSIQAEKPVEDLGPFANAAQAENVPESPTEQIVADVDKNSRNPSMLVTRPRGPSVKPSVLERQRREREQEEREQERDGKIADHYDRLQRCYARSRDGEIGSRLEWMSAARALIQDFRSNSMFYPTDRYMRFFGYTSEARALSHASRSNLVATSLTTASEREATEPHPTEGLDQTSIPQEYRGIPFDTWLEIFLEYATMQAQQGHLTEAYDTINAAWDANVFCHFARSSLLIHVCWFTCALLWNDEATLSSVSRWFMQEYQFVTDAYRLTTVVHRLCNATTTWYNCAPTQKYLLRQLKAMDFPLVGEEQKLAFPAGRAGYATKDESGNLVMASGMDVALLMLYGHLLYCGRSFTAALNYFFRAYALDPANPIINLSIALSYLHHAFKRQSDSRHQLIMQGYAFLSTYYDLRKTSAAGCEYQEADFNVGRAFHMLGLTHLAIPCYERCLDTSVSLDDSGAYGKSEKFAVEAAFALQGIWAMDGEFGRACQISEAWLLM